MVAALMLATGMASDAKAGGPERNLDQSGLALNGFDPVSYFTDGGPERGRPGLMVLHDDATYLFASEANRRQFLAEPERYLPRYGGFCAFAAAKGYKANGDPQVWKIVDGRLYLNYSLPISVLWSADQADFIVRADENWPRIAPIPQEEFE